MKCKPKYFEKTKPRERKTLGNVQYREQEMEYVQLQRVLTFNEEEPEKDKKLQAIIRR